MTNLYTLPVLAVAAFFLGMGALALLRPEQIVRFFGTTSLTRDGRNEVRAVYGGFGMSIACLLAAAPWLPGLQKGVLLSVGVALAGMALGRFVSIGVEGGAGTYPWLFLCVEGALAAVLFLVLCSLS
jgi:hypothetical protein